MGFRFGFVLGFAVFGGFGVICVLYVWVGARWLLVGGVCLVWLCGICLGCFGCGLGLSLS